MKSMTGYGSAEGQSGAVRVSVEIRSVNQRHLDVKLIAPREYGPWEADLRRRVRETVGRGRIEVYINRSAAARGAVDLQVEVARAYVRAWRKLKRELRLAGDVELSLLQGRNDIFQPLEARSDATADRALVFRLVDRALAAHAAACRREGTHLKRDIQSRLARLRAVVQTVKRLTKDRVPKVRERLEHKLRSLLADREIDESRLIQETAFLVERSDVTEELVRLESHLSALRALLSEPGSVGKRFDFLLQEVGRELNTIASKAGDVEVTTAIVEGKSELEKVREQIQNVE